MASLEEDNWILRGTRTVDTAGTLVAFGLLRDSSGLLLDRLVELGSSGGESPDILTKDTGPFADGCNTSTRASSAFRGSSNRNDTEGPNAELCTKPDESSQRMDIYVQVQKLNSG